MSALRNLRILELSTRVAGEYCGKLLADFGAEVIKIEPPFEGSATRAFGPHAGEGPAVERSGLFAYLNTNKRSATLDLTTAAGQAILARLAAGVDAVIDDHPSGWLATNGLDPHRLAEQQPRVVVCSITPFGQDPPAHLAHAHTLNVFHGSGWGYHSPSEPDLSLPPLKGAGRFLAEYESGMNAAMCVVAALHAREADGKGQFIDISQQESMASLADYCVAQMLAGAMETSTKRTAFDLRGPGTFFECADGWLYLWMSEPGHWEGMKKLLGEPQWMAGFPERWLELAVTPELIQQCRDQLSASLRPHRRDEISARAQALGVPLVPVNDAQDVFESEQIRFRQFFTELDHPVLGRVPYPTVPYRLSATPATLRQPAPLLGAQTSEILATFAGCDAGELQSLRESGAT